MSWKMDTIKKFEVTIFGSIYKILFNTQERTKAGKPIVFHVIMSKLYSLVVYVLLPF